MAVAYFLCSKFNKMQFDELTETITGCTYTVANTLGNGFLEKVYENALAHELRKKGFRVEQQRKIPVHYDGIIVGEYYSDLLVEDNIMVELKAINALEDVHKAQCLHYLKATGLEICLLINFGTQKVQIKRIINSQRTSHTERAEDCSDISLYPISDQRNISSAFIGVASALICDKKPF